MYNFHFGKIILGLAPLLAKETIISKVINMVDAFRLSVSGGFDDNNRKYIETVLKLDNSKTIIFELKGNHFRTKNTEKFDLPSAGKKIKLDYSEYAQETNSHLFLDYPELSKIEIGTTIHFHQSGATLKILSHESDHTIAEVIEGKQVYSYDLAEFDGHEPTREFLSERDQKEIRRALSHGAHLTAATDTRSADELRQLRDFLAAEHRPLMKVFAKIVSPDALANLSEITAASDGVMLVRDVLEDSRTSQGRDLTKTVNLIKSQGKPVYLQFARGLRTGENYALMDHDTTAKLCELSIDGIMVDTMIHDEDTYKVVARLFETIAECALHPVEPDHTQFFSESDNRIRDYIIYNAFRITRELDVRAIVCYTHNGYTAARLSSLATRVPVIAFTEVDETFRYINLLRGVKGFKISPHFTYENLKRIGKEMIRIIFKGNISLDETVVIVQANESERDDSTDFINGLEVYKFKNI